ncbi:MAG TPA: phosphatase [Arthrobacter sp.]|nr:phosphatase [Arthrobacter sp.]
MNSQQLANYLDSVRITGHVATPREVNVRHIHRFIDGAEDLGFGVQWRRAWTYDDVFELMHHRVGTSSDHEHLEGQDTISAQLCVAALDRFADRLSAAVSARQSILFATGHPAGLFPVHTALAAATAAAGCGVVEIPDGIPFDAGDIRQIGRVLMWHQHGSLMHTHSPAPMQLALQQLEVDGVPVPDLVVADHGWAGQAAEQGIDTIGFADCNDPGLFVSEAQGQLQVAVPLDDNVAPGLYEPLVKYVLERARLN